jgi:hypothetical protein
MAEFQKLVQYGLLEKTRASTCGHTIGLYMLNDILLLIQHYDRMKVVNYVRISRAVPGQFPVGPGKMRFHIALSILTTYFKIRVCYI